MSTNGVSRRTVPFLRPCCNRNAPPISCLGLINVASIGVSVCLRSGLAETWGRGHEFRLKNSHVDSVEIPATTSVFLRMFSGLLEIRRF